MKTHQIVVVGGGVTGLTLAALLASGRRQRALGLTLVDAGNPPAFVPEDDIGLRVSAVSVGSMRILDTLGVRRRVTTARACAYRDMVVWDAAGSAAGPQALRFGAAELALSELGHIVEDALLRHALYERLAALPVTLRFNTSLAGMTRTAHAYRVTLSDGEMFEPSLLVGADGAQSPVRRKAGIAVHGWRYGQAAVVTHARPDAPHRHTAWQRFLRDGPLALLPLDDGRVSIVWTTPAGVAEELLAADSDEFEARLGAASDYVLGELRLAAPRASFALHASHARHYVQEGLALIGDAAHTVHPLAGQGANLGFADAAALAAVVHEALAGNQHPGDLPVLRRYERARKGANNTMLYFVDGLNRLFGAPLLSGLRGAGMRLFNHSGPLRRRAMQVALGLDPPLP